MLLLITGRHINAKLILFRIFFEHALINLAEIFEFVTMYRLKCTIFAEPIRYYYGFYRLL